MIFDNQKFFLSFFFNLFLVDCYLLSKLCLEELDIFGKVEGVFPTLPYHVGVQNLICLFEDKDNILFIWNSI